MKTNSPSPIVTSGHQYNHTLNQIGPSSRALNFHFCGASVAMQMFTDSCRRFKVAALDVQIGKRRKPVTLRRRGVRGRKRVLRDAIDSRGIKVG